MWTYEALQLKLSEAGATIYFILFSLPILLAVVRGLVHAPDRADKVFHNFLQMPCD
jgi:hypothetical protein